MNVIYNMIQKKVEEKGTPSLDPLEWSIWVDMHQTRVPDFKEVVCPTCRHSVFIIMTEDRGLIDGKQSELWYLLACGHAVRV